MQHNLAKTMRTLKELRCESTAEFAKELEISRSTLQDYLNGTGNPTLRTLEHMADKLGIDPQLLLSGGFPTERADVAPLILQTICEGMSLPKEKRQRVAELFVQIVSLWEEAE